jgi:hypothetical protein
LYLVVLCLPNELFLERPQVRNARVALNLVARIGVLLGKFVELLAVLLDLFDDLVLVLEP